MNEYINFALLYNDAISPARKHSTDAGIDLCAYLPEGSKTYGVLPNTVEKFRTGVRISIPPEFFGWITNKSGSDYLIGGGIVDSGYQGELLVKVINPTSKVITIKHGDKIAQLLIIPCLTPEVNVLTLEDLGEKEGITERGGDGGIVRQIDPLDESEEGYDYHLDDFNFDVARERRMFG